MSRIDNLIRQHCPQGVPYRALGDVGEVFRGRRFTKADYVEDGTGAIHYGELYTHYGTSATEVITRVRADLAPNLRFVKPGDVVIAEVGETLEDVGKAVAWLGSEEVAIHDGCYGFRSELNPVFAAYYLQTAAFHAEKNRHVARAKVKRLSINGLRQIRVPVPPAGIQDEIVRVLDRFQTLELELESELEAELEARQRQYAHYLAELLTLGDDVDRMRLGDVAIIGTGSHDTKDAVVDGKYAFYARGRDPLRLGSYDFDERSVITAGDGAGVGKVFHFVEGKYALHQRAYRIVPDESVVLARYLFHYLRSDFSRYLTQTSVHSSVTSLRRPMFLEYPLPVPSLAEQERIVEVLDAFDGLVNDLSVGLSAELAARRKQYEYHRDQLLSFEEAA